MRSETGRLSPQRPASVAHPLGRRCGCISRTLELAAPMRRARLSQRATNLFPLRVTLRFGRVSSCLEGVEEFFEEVGGYGGAVLGGGADVVDGVGVGGEGGPGGGEGGG